MKKFLFILAALFVLSALTSDVSAQNLKCSTYTSNTEDSIAIAGSTDAGSDWFMPGSESGDNIWLEVHNGTNWYTYLVDYPSQIPAKFKVEMEGADTTLTVQGSVGGQNIVLPLKSINSSYPDVNVLDIGGATRFRIRFRVTP